MKDSSIYESIMTGLNEALEDAKNKKPVLKRNTVTVEPVKINCYIIFANTLRTGVTMR